jgi:protein-disulfide isomerase
MNSTRLTQLTVAVAVIIIAVLIVIPRLSGGTNQAVALDLTDQPALGSAEAPVKLVMFEDFLCPACATFTNSVFPRIKREYVDTGLVEAYFVNFPVISGSETAAVAAECVYRQDKAAFWDVYEAFFRVQNELGNSRNVLQLAGTYAPGVDQAALEQCITGNETIGLVRADGQMAQASGASATPTVFVDGVKVPQASYAQIKQAIDQALP